MIYVCSKGTKHWDTFKQWNIKYGQETKKHLRTMSHRERAKRTLTSQSFSSMTTSFLIKMAFSSCSLSNLTLSSSNSISSQTFWISQQSRAIIHSSQLDQNIFFVALFWPMTRDRPLLCWLFEKSCAGHTQNREESNRDKNSWLSC